MRKTNIKWPMSVFVSALLLCLVYGGSVTAQTQLAWVSINSGGLDILSSANFAAGLSCGQTVSGASQSTNYKVTFGFWQEGVDLTNWHTGNPHSRAAFNLQPGAKLPEPV